MFIHYTIISLFYFSMSLISYLNLNGLLVTHQIDNTSPGGAPGGKSVPSRLTRDANLDTQSSDISAEEIRESGRSLQSLIVCGKKLDSDRQLLFTISMHVYTKAFRMCHTASVPSVY